MKIENPPRHLLSFFVSRIFNLLPSKVGEQTITALVFVLFPGKVYGDQAAQDKGSRKQAGIGKAWMIPVKMAAADIPDP